MNQLKKKSAKKREQLFLGFDLSTQALKALIIDEKCRVRYEKAVNYDCDLPEFNTKGGVHRHADGLTVTSPAIMWAAALDLLLERMKRAGAPFANITAISGSGQQHGSVYFKKGASRLLNVLDAKRNLRLQLARAFSIEDSPVWMDSSTSRECRKRDAALGGPQAMARLTGSRSYERFTGNQIAKIAKKIPGQYAATEHIALVSSFLASLLIGGYAPIDTGDGAGMNLMNILTKKWDKRALNCTARNLADKLPPIVDSHKAIGIIHPYFVKRYGFAEDTLVLAFSGDNPNSLAAFGLDQAGAVTISLGTSDTIFGALSKPKPSALEGHIFGNPIYPRGYMALLCWKNGSLTREYVRDKYAHGSWAVFNHLLTKTRPGNDGIIGFYFKEPEITPPVFKPGIHLFHVGPLLAEAGMSDPEKAARCKQRPYKECQIPIQNATPEQHVRAVLESQFLSMRTHCANIGLKPETIIATGGASVNKGILQIMADVFGKNIYTIEKQNSAALGAALRARHGWKCMLAGKFVPFKQAVVSSDKPRKKASPKLGNTKIYTRLLTRYRQLEKMVASILK
jgi:xylulokinase